MRKLALLVLLLVLPRPALAAVANVQCVHGEWASGTTWTASITATSTNLLAVSVHFQAGDGVDDVTGISDGANTYTPIDAVSAVVAGANESLRTYYAKNITGGALTITVSVSAAGGTPVSRATTKVCEVSGASTAAPLDQHTIQTLANPGLGSDDVTSGAVVTTVNGEYIYGAVMNETGNVAYTHGTGFTDGFLDVFSASEYQVQSSAGSIAATFASTFGNAVTYFVAVATFKSTGAASTPKRMLTLGVPR